MPIDLGQPFATWSLAELADYLVAEEVVTDISHEGLRQLLREEDVSLQALKLETLQRPGVRDEEKPDPRAVRIVDGLAEPGPGDPDAVVCLDEFGPLNLQPQPGGKAWAPRAKPKRQQTIAQKQTANNSISQKATSNAYAPNLSPNIAAGNGGRSNCGC